MLVQVRPLGCGRLCGSLWAVPGDVVRSFFVSPLSFASLIFHDYLGDLTIVRNNTQQHMHNHNGHNHHINNINAPTRQFSARAQSICKRLAHRNPDNHKPQRNRNSQPRYAQPQTIHLYGTPTHNNTTTTNDALRHATPRNTTHHNKGHWGQLMAGRLGGLAPSAAPLSSPLTQEAWSAAGRPDLAGTCGTKSPVALSALSALRHSMFLAKALSRRTKARIVPQPARPLQQTVLPPRRPRHLCSQTQQDPAHCGLTS